MYCENCNEEHDGTYGSGRFCSVKCSRGFSTKAKRAEINEAVRMKLIKNHTITKKCISCKKDFTVGWSRRNHDCCSISCASTLKGANPEIKRKISNAQRTLIENGTFVGWKSRKDKAPSYPEQYFIELFKNENISGWNRDYKVGRWFIDFAFLEKKLALEIDGKQHLERKAQDKVKDDFLIQNGWKVLRIAWYNPVNEKNKKLLYDQIKIFKDYIGV